MPEKSRFLRLLDLSLRSPKLSIKMIAAFIKRLSRIVVSFGEGFTPQDIMFIVSFIANLMKRYPRTIKLINRKIKKGQEVKKFENDPYLEDETDPLESKALRSSLWEIETLIKHHYDERVRAYCKVFKTDL